MGNALGYNNMGLYPYISSCCDLQLAIIMSCYSWNTFIAGKCWEASLRRMQSCEEDDVQLWRRLTNATPLGNLDATVNRLHQEAVGLPTKLRLLETMESDWRQVKQQDLDFIRSKLHVAWF